MSIVRKHFGGAVTDGVVPMEQLKANPWPAIQFFAAFLLLSLILVATLVD